MFDDTPTHEFHARREDSTLCTFSDGTCWAPPHHSIHGAKIFDVPELEHQQTVVLTVRMPLFGTSDHARKAVATVRRFLQVGISDNIEVDLADPPD